MNDTNIIKLLSCLGVNNASVSGEWIRSSCPLGFHRHKGGVDKKPSFGIHISDGRSGFLCYSCGLRSRDLSDLITELTFALRAPAHQPPAMNLIAAQALIDAETDPDYPGVEWAAPVVQEFEPFPDWWLESFLPVFKFPEAIAYLRKREVPLSMWSDLELRFDSERKMVCFPYYNMAGLLAGMRGRAVVTGASYRHHDYSWNYRNNSKLVLMNEHRIDWKQPVVVVEGEFDLIRVLNIYPNAVASLTASLSEPKCMTLALAASIIGFFDNDEAGHRASQQAQQRFGYAYRSVVYPEGSAKDPGAMPFSQIKKMLAPFV